jgi:hypothetical protein
MYESLLRSVAFVLPSVIDSLQRRVKGQLLYNPKWEEL